MVLSRLAAEDLALFRHFQALGIGFIRFHNYCLKVYKVENL
jgi:hypothetical protein